MSYAIAAPDVMVTAAADLATIGSSLSAAHVAAAVPTVALVPAAADEVSASIAHFFSRHAADFQPLAERAAAFHEQFVQSLQASAHSYASTEAANTSALSASKGSHVGACTAADNDAFTEWVLIVEAELNSLLPLHVTLAEAIAFVALILLLIPIGLPVAFTLLVLTGCLRILGIRL